jgi:hypothetical protein
MITFCLSWLILTGGCFGTLTPEEYIEESDPTASDAGYLGPGYVSVFDEDNRQWDQVSKDPDYDSCRTRLRGYEYQSILYKKWNSTGRVFWVFIDKRTGSVITYCSGN